MNIDYIVVENGLFKDSFTGEAVHREIERQLNSSSILTGIPIIFGTTGESQLENEQLWTDIRNETQTPEVDLSVMTEEEIINHFDTISNE